MNIKLKDKIIVRKLDMQAITIKVNFNTSPQNPTFERIQTAGTVKYFWKKPQNYL